MPSKVLKIKGSTPQYSIYYTDEAELIASTLNAAGWNVSVTEESSGYFGYGERTWKVIANLDRDYSDAEIRNQIRADLAPVMSINSVTVVPPGASFNDDEEGTNWYLYAAAGAVVLILLLNKR